MKLLAGIVLFNPNLKRLQENYEAISAQVDKVLFIDNGSNNKDEIGLWLDGKTDIDFITNDINRGIATALKQIMDFAIDKQYDWVVTLDQDSVVNDKLIDNYLKYVNIPDTGLLTCNIVDRNFVEVDQFPETGWKYVTQCITSASMMSVVAYKKTDGYDEKMFIDSVDFDICLNLKKHGLKIVKINYDGVLHEVGKGKNVRLLFKDYIVYNHSAFRNYYIARNHLYLIRKYPESFNTLKEYIREIRSEVLIILFEKNKFSKLRSRWKGIIDSKKL